MSLFPRYSASPNYIATQGITPILIGEFGGHRVENSFTERIWQQKLVDFIGQENLSFTYWSWNPNNTDTGGILQDDGNKRFFNAESAERGRRGAKRCLINFDREMILKIPLDI